MTAEKKDRKPLQIKNLADLKRHIRLGTELVATAHQYHPDIVGLTRVVTKVQTNGFYSKIKDQPDHMARFAEPEDISPEEVEADMGFMTRHAADNANGTNG